MFNTHYIVVVNQLPFLCPSSHKTVICLSNLLISIMPLLALWCVPHIKALHMVKLYLHCTTPWIFYKEERERGRSPVLMHLSHKTVVILTPILLISNTNNLTLTIFFFWIQFFYFLKKLLKKWNNFFIFSHSTRIRFAGWSSLSSIFNWLTIISSVLNLRRVMAVIYCSRECA